MTLFMSQEHIVLNIPLLILHSQDN